ncbi:MAG: ABC transporter ATP-binding protein [Lentisphaeria bacterium]|jgi:peptide/nickel transport system ATP-binding protein/oligopeptide transport system ATP-binding protein|nr:ABC transporter ATP-binding protein [Lentisphaeria bacterium]
MSHSADPLLAVRDLSVAFATDGGELVAVDGVSFSIRRGEVVGLVGESGCGKSVTAMTIPRLVPMPPGRVLGGQVEFLGRDLLAMPVAELRQLRGAEIGVDFQEPMTALSPLHRIGQQMVETIRLHEKVSRRTAWERGAQWLAKVGIPDPAERMLAYPFELSGGMRQRAMIAMAMILGPSLLIADEPTTALDVTIQAQVLDLMRDMRGTDTGMLLITHDMGVIWEMCDRVLVMYASRLVEDAPAREIFSRPLHPYTEALLKSMPVLSLGKPRLPTIPGQVPSLDALPPGCNFADRCPYVMDRCRTTAPRFLETEPGRRCACFLREAKAGE